MRGEGGGERSVQGEGGGTEGGVREGSGVREELVGLKLELAQQVQRLRELCALEDRRDREGEEEEVKKERRLAAEQVSSMARKVYDLQLQVS